MTVSAPPLDLAALDYRPPRPERPRGIGVIGCGSIVREAHLPAYAAHGFPVVGVYDIVPEAAASAARDFGVPAVDSLDALLALPGVEVVDIGVRTEDRPPLVRAALAAGHDVLSQKPFAPTLAEAEDLVAEAARRNRTLAVNQNGRWAPSWRAATLALEQGAVGEVVAITHLFDMSLAWSIGRHFNDMAHFLLYDYAVHFFDITRCWLAGKTIVEIRAREQRAPNQPPESHTEWSMWVEVTCADGTTAMIRGLGCAAPDIPRAHPFWIHGTEGTLRGAALGGDFLELVRGPVSSRLELEGAWFPDGFAGTMGELQRAVEEGREPYNAAAHNLLSLELTLAAVRSAELDGAPVALERTA
jgi:predicted dehydrogenase